MSSKTLTYEIADGYAGKSRPQHFTIHLSDFDPSMSDEDIEQLIEDAAHEDMTNNIAAEVSDIDGAIAWVRWAFEEEA